MEDRLDEWRDRLDDDEVADIIVSRLGDYTVEEMLWSHNREGKE